jgi:hypothetical protein
MYLTDDEVNQIRSKAHGYYGANAEGRTQKGVNPPDPKSETSIPKQRKTAQNKAKTQVLLSAERTEKHQSGYKVSDSGSIRRHVDGRWQVRSECAADIVDEASKKITEILQ